MTLKEAIQKAVSGDAKAAGAVADYLRFEKGLNYQQSFDVVQQVVPGMTLAKWDELLREADEEPT